MLLALNYGKWKHGHQNDLDETLAYAREAEKSYKNGVLHVLTAYEVTEDYVQAADLARLTDVPAERIHVIGDSPEQAITKCADDLDAELVILGGPNTSRLSGLLFGSTTEWLLNHMDRDVMVVITE